jgi:hypothetical protein
MIGLGAGEAALVVPAARVIPVGVEFPAGGRRFKAGLHFGPGRGTMLLDVAPGNLVRDALKAKRR